jgi:hypothetical protein
MILRAGLRLVNVTEEVARRISRARMTARLAASSSAAIAGHISRSWNAQLLCSVIAAPRSSSIAATKDTSARHWITGS